MPNGENQPVEIFTLFLARFRFLAVLTIGLGLAIIAASFLLPKVYRAECALVPSSRLQDSGTLNFSGALRGASNFMGLNLGGSGGDLSPLFTLMARDPGFTRNVLSHQLDQEQGEASNLARYLDVDFDGSDLAFTRLAKTLNREILKIGVNEKTGITTLAVELGDPVLARVVADICVKELDAAHRRILNAQSQELVAFLDKRLESAAKQLIDSEKALEIFYENNRVIQGVPNLEFQNGRLLRDIQLKNDIFLSLSGQLEVARIEMFKNMPTIVVLSAADQPDKPYKPNRPLVVVLAFALSFFVAFSVVLVQVGRKNYLNSSLAAHD